MAFELLKKGTPHIRGVLFDMDGVVIDSERLYTRFWMEAAHDLGFPMTREQALQLRSLGRIPAQAKLDSFFGPGEACYDSIRNRRIELMEAYIALHGVDEKPGIRELLTYLSAHGITCAITSSSSVPLIRRHLGNLGLADYFTALCSGKDVPRENPPRTSTFTAPPYWAWNRRSVWPSRTLPPASRPPSVREPSR